MLNDFFSALISAMFVGGVAGYLGCLMLSRKMTIVIDPLSHLALPGVALSLIFQKDISLGAFLFLFFGAILIWFFEQKTKLPTETIIAILFSVSLAITFLFLSEQEIEEALVGDISKVGKLDSLIIVLISIFIFFLIQKIYPKLTLISISEDLAKAEKISIKKYQFLYILSISAIAALGVKFVGGLLVAGLTVLPAAAAMNVSKNLRSFKTLSSIFGVVAVILGSFIFKITDFEFGPLVVISSFLLFIFSMSFKALKKMVKFSI
jgi:ABC-type Mn2+/Zn2+ transport system permease subunit